MIEAAAALLIGLGAGLPIYLALRGDCRAEELLGGGFLTGMGIGGLALFLLDLFGVRWNRLWLLVLLGAAVALSFSFLLRRPRRILGDRRQGLAALVVDAATLLVLIGYALFATAAPLPEFDFLTNWGLKGRLFWEHGGIDWHYLETAWDRSIHADYPPLLPLMFDYVAVLAGRWDDRSIGLLFAALGGAALLILRSMFREETRSSLLVSLATLALVSAAVSPWVGLAEGPLVAYGTAGLLLMRAWVRNGDPRALTTGAVLLGFAGLAKNEGVALILAATVALAIVHGRSAGGRVLIRLWPAYLLAGSWQLLRSIHGLATDLTVGDVWSRVVMQLGNPLPLLEALSQHTPGKPWFWAGVATALLLQLRTAVKREAFLLLVLGVQFVFYLGAYAVTPHEVGWHIRWSWERLVYHLTLPLGAVALMLLMPLLEHRTPRSAV